MNRRRGVEECASFAEFYPCYLNEHTNRLNRRLHVLGSTLVTHRAGLCVAHVGSVAGTVALLIGYGLAWIRHFYLAKNKPATSTHPAYGFIGDWAMYKDIL